MTIETLVAQYGYLVLLVGTFFEGETILVAAGFAAHQGYLKLPWVILAAFIGSLSGDQFYFFVGRLRGRSFLQKRSLWQAQSGRVQHLLDRYGTWIIVGFRFMYGLRTVTPFVIGLSDITVRRFFVLNAVGALIWALVIGSCGFLFGAVLEAVLENIRKIEHWIALGILGVGTVVWVIYFVRKKHRV